MTRAKLAKQRDRRRRNKWLTLFLVAKIDVLSSAREYAQLAQHIADRGSALVIEQHNLRSSPKASQSASTAE
jgi:hypothetical protein